MSVAGQEGLAGVSVPAGGAEVTRELARNSTQTNFKFLQAFRAQRTAPHGRAQQGFGHKGMPCGNGKWQSTQFAAFLQQRREGGRQGKAGSGRGARRHELPLFALQGVRGGQCTFQTARHPLRTQGGIGQAAQGSFIGQLLAGREQARIARIETSVKVQVQHSVRHFELHLVMQSGIGVQPVQPGVDQPFTNGSGQASGQKRIETGSHINIGPPRQGEHQLRGG